MTASTQTAAPTRCRRCRRPLRNTKSAAAGIGPGCLRLERTETAGYTPEQAAKAVTLVRDGGITLIRGGLDALYRVEGAHCVYWASQVDCTCRGAAECGSCYHVLGVRILAAGRVRPSLYALAA